MTPTNAPTPQPPSSSVLPTELWFDELKTAADPAWLWQGYLAAGNVTLLTSQWKSGKTSLTAVLLSRMKHGGVLAGLAVKPGKAVVISEEGPAHWAKRGEKLDLAGHVCWFCRSFRTKPGPDEWLLLLDRILELRRAHGLLMDQYGETVIEPTREAGS